MSKDSKPETLPLEPVLPSWPLWSVEGLSPSRAFSSWLRAISVEKHRYNLPCGPGLILDLSRRPTSKLSAKDPVVVGMSYVAWKTGSAVELLLTRLIPDVKHIGAQHEALPWLPWVSCFSYSSLLLVLELTHLFFPAGSANC